DRLLRNARDARRPTRLILVIGRRRSRAGDLCVDGWIAQLADEEVHPCLSKHVLLEGSVPTAELSTGGGGVARAPWWSGPKVTPALCVGVERERFGEHRGDPLDDLFGQQASE